MLLLFEITIGTLLSFAKLKRIKSTFIGNLSSVIYPMNNIYGKLTIQIRAYGNLFGNLRHT